MSKFGFMSEEELSIKIGRPDLSLDGTVGIHVHLNSQRNTIPHDRKNMQGKSNKGEIF